LRASAQADTAAASAAETEAAETGASLDVVGSAEATELHRSAWDEDPEWAALTTARPAAAAPSAAAAPAASAPGANGNRAASGTAVATKAAAALNAVPLSAGRVAAKVAGLGEGARPEGAVRSGERKPSTSPNGGNAPGRAAKRTPERGR
jgi:translation initiation factor IF-2